MFCDDAGGLWYAMQKTLGTYSKAQKKWSLTPGASVRKPHHGTAKQLQAIFLAKRSSILCEALAAADCMPDQSLDLRALRRLLSKHVLVLQGAPALDFWAASSPAGAEDLYRQAVCFNCNVFGLHGTCEHVHLAFLHSGVVSLTKACMPAPPTKKKKRAATPTILLPAKEKKRRGTPQTPTAKSTKSGLKSLLARLGMATLFPLFQKEEVDVPLLSTWDLPTMKAYFPDIAAGPATKILQACKLQAGEVVMTPFHCHVPMPARQQVKSQGEDAEDTPSVGHLSLTSLSCFEHVHFAFIPLEQAESEDDHPEAEHFDLHWAIIQTTKLSVKPALPMDWFEV